MYIECVVISLSIICRVSPIESTPNVVLTNIYIEKFICSYVHF